MTQQGESASSATGGRLLRESVWVVGGRVLGIVTAISINVLLARILPPADVGVFFLLSTILTFAAILAMFGLNAGLVRFVSECIGLQDTAAARRTLKHGAVLSGVSILIGGGGCWAFLLAFGNSLFGLGNLAVLAPLVAVGVVASATLQLCGSLLRSFHDSRLSILLTGQFGGPVSNLLFIFSSMILYWLARPTLPQVLLLCTLSMCLLMPIAIFCLYRIGGKRLAVIDGESKSEQNRETQSIALATLLAACMPLMLTQGLSYVTGQADIWIAGASVAHEELALYGAARRLMLLIGMPMQLVNLTVIASIAELRAQGRLDDLQRILRSAATLAGAIAIAIWFPMLIIPEYLCSHVFGDYYAEGATVLRILSVGQIVFVCVGAAELTLMMAGQQNIALGINVVTSIILFVLGTWLTRQWGIIGLAVAWSCVVSLQCICFCVFARKSVGVWTAMDLPLLLQVPKMLATAKAKFVKA